MGVANTWLSFVTCQCLKWFTVVPLKVIQPMLPSSKSLIFVYILEVEFLIHTHNSGRIVECCI